jgi:hypothetical protein
MRGATWLLRGLAAVAVLAFATAAPAGNGPPTKPGGGQNAAGFQTSVAAMLKPLAPGATVQPIISVGDTLDDGYMFESIPDGISIARVNGRGTADILVNHETSLVPFPLPTATAPGRVDFTNAMVSRLRLHQHSAGVLSGEFAIPSTANYQRFCSNFIAGEEQGFERELFFTNEEATDFVNRTGVAWPAGPGAEQAGVVVALDPKSGAYRSIYGMGRHNHENSVAVPGYGHPVVLSGDDTFSAPASQLYLYSAASAAAVWDDTGTLYAFKSDDATVNDYGDLTIPKSVSGTFIPVPEAIAKGDQTALENWSNANGVFQFIRIEDLAYDRTTPNVVYFADTGEPRAVTNGNPDPLLQKLMRGVAGTQGPYPNGRIFKLVLDPSNPLEVTSLSILVDSDAAGYNKAGTVLHQPDNVETTANSLFVQEDPGSHNQGVAYAAIWRYDLKTGAFARVAETDQSAKPALQIGSWESSGIVDASAIFGPGAFLVDVQAHGWELEEAPSATPNIISKREAGQLLLIRIPGA